MTDVAMPSYRSVLTQQLSTWNKLFFFNNLRLWLSHYHWRQTCPSACFAEKEQHLVETQDCFVITAAEGT